MTALHPARQGPSSPPPVPLACRVPFPVVDEIARHCLQDEEPDTVHIEVHLPRRIEHERLRAAFAAALQRHPRVLMRQAPDRWWRRRYEWQLTGVPDVDPVSFPGSEPDALARARQRALTHCPPLSTSPPLRMEAVDQGEGSVLVLTLNHTALDGPSCIRVLATVAELYGGVDNSPTAAPVGSVGPRTDRPHNGSSRPTNHIPARPARIAADTTVSGGAGTTGNGMLITELPVPQRPPRPAPYTVNDQLLVATCLTVARWNHLHDRPTAPIVVTMPIDDRTRGADMPLGNGTRLVSVGFGPEEHTDAALLTTDPPAPAAVARLLHRTAVRTRALKATNRRQLGLAAAVLTTPVLPVGLRAVLTRGLRTAAAPWTSTTLVSNIGRIPYPLDFGDAGRPTAVWFSAPARMPRGVTVTTVSVGGRIQLALRWSRALLDDDAGTRLGRLFEQSLAATCWSPGGPGGVR
ncbi:condensation protein [Streptomyces sp. NPDC001970]